MPYALCPMPFALLSFALSYQLLAVSFELGLWPPPMRHVEDPALLCGAPCPMPSPWNA